MTKIFHCIHEWPRGQVLCTVILIYGSHRAVFILVICLLVWISVVNSGSTAPSSFPHELQIISLCRCLCHEGDCPQKSLTAAHVTPPSNRHTPTPIFAICHPAVVNTCLGDISSSLSFPLRSVDKKLLFLVYSVFVN